MNLRTLQLNPVCTQETWIPVDHGDDSVFTGISLWKAGDLGLSAPGGDEGRKRLFSGLGLSSRRIVMVRQIHGLTVVNSNAFQPADEMPEADGTISRSDDTVLAVTVADCLPIFISDRKSGAIGMLHSGWKGTGIILEAVHGMKESFGSRAGDLCVTIGPGIGSCCYEVDSERAREFAGKFGSDTVVWRDGKPSLDLRKANLHLAREAGVGSVTIISDCTCCTPWLGSYRREGQAFHRMVAFIGRRGD